MPNDFTISIDHTLAIARCNTDVRLFCLTRTVDYASKHTDLHGRLVTRKSLFQLGDDLLQIDGKSPTRWTSNQFGLSHPPAGGLQDFITCVHFRNRVAEQTDADR